MIECLECAKIPPKILAFRLFVAQAVKGEQVLSICSPPLLVKWMGISNNQTMPFVLFLSSFRALIARIVLFQKFPFLRNGIRTQSTRRLSSCEKKNIYRFYFFLGLRNGANSSSPKRWTQLSGHFVASHTRNGFQCTLQNQTEQKAKNKSCPKENK